MVIYIAKILMIVQTIMYIVAGGLYCIGDDYRLGLTSILYGLAVYILYLS